MYRYLLNISYIGTPFKGVQRQVTGLLERPNDNETVQGIIEAGLKTLRPLNIPVAVVSSRTDAGVHSFSSTMHVDLQHHKTAYQPENITISLNKYFSRKNFPVRILKTYHVPSSFHCRHNAIARTYLYKFAVIKGENKKILTDYIPIEDHNRCLYFCADKFDLNEAKEAAKLFLGKRDFRSFMAKSTSKPDKITRRIVEQLDFFESNPVKYYSAISRPIPDCRYYEVVFKASGFLYKQVRRTVASLIAVAKGVLATKDIKFMIEIPSHQSWNPRINTVPAHGLYLCQVFYLKEDLHTFKENVEI